MKAFRETGNVIEGMNVVVYVEFAENKKLPFIIRSLGGITLLKNRKYEAFTYHLDQLYKVKDRWIVNTIQEGKNKILGIQSGQQLSIFHTF